MKLERYIRASRKRIGHEINNIKYSRILSEVAGQKAKNIYLKLLYSINKKVEVINIDNQNHLIYDQYLGQTFYELNKIYFGASNNDAGLCYSFKLVSEGLELRNYLNASLYMAHHFTNFFPAFKNVKPFEKEVNFFSTIQEYFVIAHELSHILIEEKNTNNIFAQTENWLSKTYDELLNNKNLTEDGVGESLADSIMTTLKIPKEAKGSIETQIKSFYKGDLIKYSESCQKIIHRNDFLEEVICDELATKILLKLNLTRPTTLIRAIHIGLLHLRLLSIADRMSEQIKNKDIAIGDFFTETNIRLNAFRKSIETTVKLDYPSMDLEKFIDQLNEDSKRHSELIANPLLYSTQTDINELGKSDNYTKRKYNLKERKEISQLLNKALRWKF